MPISQLNTMPRRLVRLLTLSTFAGSLVSGSASATTPASCQACHSDAARAAVQAPALNGQQQAYLRKQLQQLQAGERGGDDSTAAPMLAIAKALNPAEIDALALHFSQQPYAPHAATGQPALSPQQQDAGRRLYIGSCGACHGDKAQGNQALHAPALSLQSAAYLSRQLQLFRNGARGNQKTDKPGRQMAMMARHLSDADIDAVAAYIGAGLP